MRNAMYSTAGQYLMGSAPHVGENDGHEYMSRNPRDAEIIMILIRLNLPADVARLILQFVRQSFWADSILPMSENLEIVSIIKRVLKPSEHWEGLVEVDLAVIDTGWDRTNGRRNLSTFYRYCGLIEHVYNNWAEYSVVTRPSTAIIRMVWQKRKRLILSSFGRP